MVAPTILFAFAPANAYPSSGVKEQPWKKWMTLLDDSEVHQEFVIFNSCTSAAVGGLGGY